MSEIRCAGRSRGGRRLHRRLLGYLDRLPGGEVKVRPAEGIKQRRFSFERQHPVDEQQHPVDEQQQLMDSLVAASFVPGVDNETLPSGVRDDTLPPNQQRQAAWQYGVLVCPRHGELEYSLDVLRVQDRDGQLGRVIYLGRRQGHGLYRAPTEAEGSRETAEHSATVVPETETARGN